MSREWPSQRLVVPGGGIVHSHWGQRRYWYPHVCLAYRKDGKVAAALATGGAQWAREWIRLRMADGATHATSWFVVRMSAPCGRLPVVHHTEYRALQRRLQIARMRIDCKRKRAYEEGCMRATLR